MLKICPNCGCEYASPQVPVLTKIPNPDDPDSHAMVAVGDELYMMIDGRYVLYSPLRFIAPHP